MFVANRYIGKLEIATPLYQLENRGLDVLNSGTNTLTSGL